ncbi:MAG: hypothetical protein M0Z28_18165 [Rhodospirillales bacterium]|nr:hypothetical protein [Rhodospirillales bacterium]
MLRKALLLTAALLLCGAPAYAQSSLDSGNPAAALFNRPLYLGTGVFQAGGITNTPISGSAGAFTSLNATGAVSLTGSGTALSLPNGYPSLANGFIYSDGSGSSSTIGSFHADSNWGGILHCRSGGIADCALQDSGGTVQLEVRNGTDVYIPNLLTTKQIQSTQVTQSLSSANPYPLINLLNNYSGTSGTGNFTVANITANADTMTAPSGATFTMLGVNDYPGLGAAGNRVAIAANIAPTAATTQSANGDYVAFAGTINMNYSAGGTSTSPRGAQWGAVLQSQITSSSVAYWGEVTSLENDCGAVTGSTLAEMSCQKIVARGSGSGGVAVAHGSVLDVGLAFNGSYVSGTSTDDGSFNNLITVGSYSYGSPTNPQSYILQWQWPFGPSGGQPVAAGGIDLVQGSFSGTGNTGGGFAWRSPGSLIDASGNLWSDNASLVSSATGATLDANVETLTGTPTVVAGGSNAVVGQPLADDNGDLLTVATVSSGAVATVNVLVRGHALSTNLPANPVTFNCLPGTSSGACTGPVTLNLSWALSNSGAPQLALGGVAIIVAKNLPTSCTSEPTGTLWNNANVVNVCP